MWWVNSLRPIASNHVKTLQPCTADSGNIRAEAIDMVM